MRQLYLDVAQFTKIVMDENIDKNVTSTLHQLYSFLKNCEYNVSIVNSWNDDKQRQCWQIPKSYYLLNHSFLLVSPVHIDVNSQEIDKVMIVDPGFKHQFEIARASEMYKNILKCVPQVFIGSRSDLFNAVAFLVNEAHKSFIENEFPIPPWRKKKSFLSKWRILFQ